MKNSRSILAGMVVVMLVIVSGCNTAGKAFARSLASTAAHQAVVSGVQNEIEGPRGTTVNVVTQAPAAASAGWTTYTIQKGDTLWSITVRCLGDGRRFREILAANPGLNASKLAVGQTINIPPR